MSINIIRILFPVALLLVTLQSCSYRMRRVETTDGQKVWVKDYKDYKVAEEKRDQNVFEELYTEQSYPKYSGKIDFDTINNSTFIQFDSVRVYLFNGTSKYRYIFTTGLLSGQMIYCERDSSCIPQAPLVYINSKNGDTLAEEIWGWTGHTITVDYFEELSHVKSKPTQRRFKFWVYPYKRRFNGGNDIFFLELTNENANESTEINAFIKGAQVTYLKKAWMMI